MSLEYTVDDWQILVSWHRLAVRPMGFDSQFGFRSGVSYFPGSPDVKMGWSGAWLRRNDLLPGVNIILTQMGGASVRASPLSMTLG